MQPPQKTVIQQGGRIRVLVVDDSTALRSVVQHALEDEPAIAVVGTAANGAQALARIPTTQPHLILLDIDMPEMDGLETLRELRKTNKDVRVIMFTTQSERGATAMMEALSLGADDYLTKAAPSLAELRSELISKIKQFFMLEHVGEGVAHRAYPSLGIRPAVVAIGVSTGGPNALAEMIPHIPAGFPLPILIVQHMPPMFTRLLAKRLQNSAHLTVVEGEDGMPVQRGKIIIAPGDYHMRVRKSGTAMLLALDQGAPENSCRPAADVLFRSLDEAYGPAVISVVLTGMGSDGLRGVEALKISGAQVIVQDQASSVVWGMPGAVARAGLADCVLPLSEIVPELLRRSGRN